MSEFLIEQTPEELKATAAFQTHAELVQIALKRFGGSSAEEDPAIKEGIELSLKHKPLKAVASSELAVFDIEIVFDALADGQAEKRLFHIECCYELRYRLRKGYAPSKDELAAFHAGNALFQCWPFAREFVQNATQRMGLTVPPVPMFRVQLKRPVVATPDEGQSNAVSRGRKRARRPALNKA